ncbi:GNAT family N-acetyltransferase [Streptomyces sp. NPDC048383]|uniref:GNAT family N-acetyltransferase n=1 Tax=Streptomyces sp. NPDC048383 TaxID=3155386 RepID=UPI003433DC25
MPHAWGYTVDVGLTGHVMRHVLHSADEATVRGLSEHATVPGIWLKALVPPDTLESWLAPGWHLAGGLGYLMAAPLTGPHTRSPDGPPAGYRLTTWTRDGVTRVLVRTAEGAFAARGQVAVTALGAVVDQVETDPVHQRRGLGRLVMRELTATAAEQGATAGVLGATPDGRALYETMGWRSLAPLTGAVRDPGRSADATVGAPGGHEAAPVEGTALRLRPVR